MNNSPTDLFLNKVGNLASKLCKIRFLQWFSGIVHQATPYRREFEPLAELPSCQAASFLPKSDLIFARQTAPP
jgi:hypothetical protein